MSTIDSENNGKSASEKRALVAAVLLAKSTRMRLLSRNIGSVFRPPESLQRLQKKNPPMGDPSYAIGLCSPIARALRLAPTETEPSVRRQGELR